MPQPAWKISFICGHDYTLWYTELLHWREEEEEEEDEEEEEGGERNKQ
jgi:hypothetical protein